MSKYRQEIIFTPAYDKRHKDPTRNYGIHCVEIRFHLYGPKGVVQFVLYTNWHLPKVDKEFDKKHLQQLLSRPQDAALLVRTFYKPLPADVGYHSPVPMYEGHNKMGSTRPKRDKNGNWIKKKTKIGDKEMELHEWEGVPDAEIPGCNLLDGKHCYYDGSGLAAERFYNILRKKGSEGVWKALKNYYLDTFERKNNAG